MLQEITWPNLCWPVRHTKSHLYSSVCRMLQCETVLLGWNVSEICHSAVERVIQLHQMFWEMRLCLHRLTASIFDFFGFLFVWLAFPPEADLHSRWFLFKWILISGRNANNANMSYWGYSKVFFLQTVTSNVTGRRWPSLWHTAFDVKFQI